MTGSARGSDEWRRDVPRPPPAPVVPPPRPLAPPTPAPFGQLPAHPGARTRTSGLAVGSLVLGIVGFFMITALLAVIFGHVALSQIKRSMGTLTGRGMAIAGLVLGYVWLTFFLVLVVLAATGVIETATPEQCRRDRAILALAEERYAGQHGHYTDERGLVRAGYLERESDLHSIGLFGDGPSSAGRYEIVPEAACD